MLDDVDRIESDRALGAKTMGRKPSTGYKVHTKKGNPPKTPHPKKAKIDAVRGRAAGGARNG